MIWRTTGPAGGTRRWMRALLVVSLALNLLVAGIAGGALFKWSHGGRPHPPRLDMAGGPLTRALAPEDRHAIGREMRRAYRSGDTPHADLRAELEGLVTDLNAAPFDATAVERRLVRHRAAFVDRLERGQQLLLDRLVAMSPEERRAYAQRLGAGLARHDAKHRRDRRDD